MKPLTISATGFKNRAKTLERSGFSEKPCININCIKMLSCLKRHMPTLASIIDRYTDPPRLPDGGRWHRGLVGFHREKTRTRERARKESGAQGFSRTARLSKLLTSTWFRLTRALEALISMHINHKTANGITGAGDFHQLLAKHCWAHEDKHSSLLRNKAGRRATHINI